MRNRRHVRRIRRYVVRNRRHIGKRNEGMLGGLEGCSEKWKAYWDT